ncbi:UNVERIFIED_CONTAM: hypothetical protein RMT77_007316 [Armadillidium vulgare]
MILVSLSKARPEGDLPIPAVDGITDVANFGNLPGGLGASAINPNSGGGTEDTEPQDTEVQDTESGATDSEATGGGDANPPATE